MRLKISQLTNLQDARYSAAVGFDLVGFSLERGNNHKLSASMIWNMVQWLTGPEIVLEMNVASLEELSEIDQTFTYQWITLPVEEWNELVFTQTEAGIMLRANAESDPENLRRIIAVGAAHDRQIYIELTLHSSEETLPFASILKNCYLHFQTLDGLEAYLEDPGAEVGGISIGLEAEEEPGVLHYERLDEIVERVLELREN